MNSTAQHPLRLGTRWPTSGFARASIVLLAATLVLSRFVSAAPVTAQSGYPLRITQITQTCGAAGVSGVIAISSTGSTVVRGRAYIYLDTRPDASAPWTSSAAPGAVVDVDVPAGGSVATPVGPLVAQDSTALSRLGVRLDVISVTPAGAIVAVTVDTAVSTDSCGGGNSVPALPGGGGIQLGSVSAICDGFNIQGLLVVENTSSQSRVVTVSAFAAYHEGLQWLRGTARPAVSQRSP